MSELMKLVDEFKNYEGQMLHKQFVVQALEAALKADVEHICNMLVKDSQPSEQVRDGEFNSGLLEAADYLESKE